MPQSWRGVVSCSLLAAACFATFACGSVKSNDTTGGAGGDAEVGAGDQVGHGGAVSGGSGGAAPFAGTAGSAGLELAPTAPVDPDPPQEEPPEPHGAKPCVNPQPHEAGGGYLVCEDKSLRLGERSACPTTLPREAPTEPLFFEDCALDADCTAAAHGFCEYGQCKYGCVSDDECGAGQLCFCGADVGACVPAECRSDAECPADYPCTGNQPFGVDTASFRCQTPLDECESDYDCPGARMHCGVDGERRYCYRDLVG